eukprot:3490212-Pleurochrysis_carterae.AAC.1
MRRRERLASCRGRAKHDAEGTENGVGREGSRRNGGKALGKWIQGSGARAPPWCRRATCA